MAGVIRKTVTILSGQSLSDAVGIGNLLLVGILMPAAWTAADLTFQGGDKVQADLATYGNLFDSDGDELTVSAAAGRFLGFTATEAEVLSSAASLKIRSGLSSAAVNQAADREIVLVLK